MLKKLNSTSIIKYILTHKASLLFFAIYFPVCIFVYNQLNIPVAHADTASDLLNQISQLQNQLNNAKSQEKTLSSQLSYIDNQTRLTELKIQETQYEITKLNTEITDLNGRISTLSNRVDQLTSVLLNRIVTTYKYDNVTPIDLIFSAQNFGDLLERLKYLQVIQANDKKVLYQLQATQNNYTDQKQDKQTREAQQKKYQQDFQNYQTQLASQKREKQQLLADTQGSESNYQRLLAQARAQLAALSRFSSSRGVSIISHIDRSDSWGKYYNQRDENWGRLYMGDSNYTVSSVGCLITSFAMVASHYGNNITPAYIASDPSYFSAGTAYFKIGVTPASGHPESYLYSPSTDQLRNYLHSGYSVIIRMAAGDQEHWVVVREITNGGDYLIMDPWYPPADSGPIYVSKSLHYSGWAITNARIYR